jgi:ribosomal protein S18 acetylase RimI-like enzyme
MDDEIQEWRRGEYLISTDRGRLDRAAALALLSETHWATTLTASMLERAIAHSVCFGIYRGVALVGFGRVITDLATYGYLTDVVVAAAERGHGLGRWLTQCMVHHPQLQGFRRLALLTRDAEQLYLHAGFTVGAARLVYMELRAASGVVPPSASV